MRHFSHELFVKQKRNKEKQAHKKKESQIKKKKCLWLAFEGHRTVQH